MLIERLIPERKLILPWGGTAEGKTYFTGELATAIAMRRPAFGMFKVLRPGDRGLVVMFAGEDCDELDRSRLVAIEQRYGRSLDGLLYTTDLALPLDDLPLFAECVAEIRRIRDLAGRPIDAIFDDTLGRSLGTLPPNDGETGHPFTVAMEKLIAEFGCSVIVNAHEPKTGGTISGTQRFLDNAPVTPHVEGIKSGPELRGFKVTMEPKYRIGAPPKPFTAHAEPVALPEPVNGSHTDLVFKIAAAGGAAEPSTVRAKILAALPTDGSPMNIQFVCDASGLRRDTIANHVRGKKVGAKVRVKADCADLVVRDDDGLPSGQVTAWMFRLPG